MRGHYRYFECLCKGIHFKKEQFKKGELWKAEERAASWSMTNSFIQI